MSSEKQIMGMDFRATKGASVTETEQGFRLTITEGRSLRYRLAQLDDYSNFPRRRFPHHSLTLSLRARASSNSIPGTWGFGVWNDPFVMSLGLGGVPFRLPAPPNAAWFFSASSHSHLSFIDKPGQGFLAQTFRAPGFHPLLIAAVAAFPFSRKGMRRLLARVIDEDGVALSVDVTQWHEYKLDWNPRRAYFKVDDAPVLETSISPRGPLGIVIWIDNQYMAFTPEGRFAYGLLEGKAEWIEIENLEIKRGPE